MTGEASPAYRFVRVAPGDGSVTLTLDNPAKKNALGARMVAELNDALHEAVLDERVRAIVLTGAGDAFCAGGDFSQMSGSDEGPPLGAKGDYADLLLGIVRCPKPVVARVNGHAFGGGLGLVAAAHFAVAVETAKLGTPEIHVGLFPMMIMAVLSRIVPRRRLLEMMLFGERMDAGRAAELGLVNRTAKADELDAAVEDIVARVRSKSGSTIRLGLEAFAAQDDLDLEHALPLLRDRLAQCLATDDAQEGLRAFLEKRAPVWTGK